ncbi:HpcH/HpaI aldolase/citrate lyase family protein [Luteimonas sp. A537]
MKSIARVRSLLFVPGNRPDRFAKAATSGAHAVVLDLEDAVSPDDKARARDAVAAWLASDGDGIVRMNAVETPWHAADIDMLARSPGTTVMLPKADADSIARTIAALPGYPVIALVETVRGYKELPRIAASHGVQRIAFGSIDFAAESGIQDIGDAMTSVRSAIVLESCFAGLAAPLDGVSTSLDDESGIRTDALRSRQLGFGGKLCIHPRQVLAVNTAFMPTSHDVDWAQRVLAAIEASDGGATTVDGKMIDKPVVEQARTILADAAESTC